VFAFEFPCCLLLVVGRLLNAEDTVQKPGQNLGQETFGFRQPTLDPLPMRWISPSKSLSKADVRLALLPLVAEKRRVFGTDRHGLDRIAGRRGGGTRFGRSVLVRPLFGRRHRWKPT
jgi:hypothetical protein